MRHFCLETCLCLCSGWAPTSQLDRMSSQPNGILSTYLVITIHNDRSYQTFTPINACFFNFIVQVAMLCLIFAGPVAIGAIFSIGAVGA